MIVWGEGRLRCRGERHERPSPRCRRTVKPIAPERRHPGSGAGIHDSGQALPRAEPVRNSRKFRSRSASAVTDMSRQQQSAAGWLPGPVAMSVRACCDVRRVSVRACCDVRRVSVRACCDVRRVSVRACCDVRRAFVRACRDVRRVSARACRDVRRVFARACRDVRRALHERVAACGEVVSPAAPPGRNSEARRPIFHLMSSVRGYRGGVWLWTGPRRDRQGGAPATTGARGSNAAGPRRKREDERDLEFDLEVPRWPVTP